MSSWVSHFANAKLLWFFSLLPSPFHHSSLSPSAGSFPTDICSKEWWTKLWSNYHSLHFLNQLAVVCIKNISTKSQQGVKGNRISHLKANDVLPSEQELWILIFWLLSHLYNFQLLLNEGRLVPIMWYYIITMLMLKASYFTPSTCGSSARMKALMCQLAFRFCIRKSLILETYLSTPCGWAQEGLGSRRAAWGACCPRQALCCSQRLGINITERARAELFPQSVHIMDVNVKMPPSEVWAPWNKTKNYWRCQLSGMLFRGGGKLHTQHQLSSASSFLIKGWPQALFLHRQSYTDLS